MGELEDKINSILSSPEEMEKIMGLARSLSESGLGDSIQKNDEGKPDPPGMDPSSLFGGVDPKMLGMMRRLMGASNRLSNEKTAVLRSIKPFLKKERREKLERASELARIAKLSKTALGEIPGGE
ncbi:MAG: hypothetical protein K5756_00140 [Clostridiales bacterium]|nr:hypothetical protein [Clostridiales bacterium]